MPDENKYDLAERLLRYSVRIVSLVEQLPGTRAGNHIASQLIRSGTSPMPNHGEAQAAESQADFVHKMKICLKELRESYRWLRLIEALKLAGAGDARDLAEETDQLVRIFRKSIQTASGGKDGRGGVC